MAQAVANKIPAEAMHLIESPNFASVATLMDDGSPHASTVWIDAEDGQLVFNTAEGRLKPANIRDDCRIAIAVHNEENPYEQLMIRGKAQLDHSGAEEHIDALAKKYLGKDTYPWRQPGEKRVKVRLIPEKVNYSPGG